MKLVKFDNGKYGIRTYWFFGWCFKCLLDNFDHKLGSKKFEEHCLNADLEKVRKRMRDITPPPKFKEKYTIIKD